jgi:hypothetical protein
MLHTKEKIMQEQGKQNLESNSITQSFLNESFEVLDLASSTGNETTTLSIELRINRCPVSEKKIGCQARQQPIFGNIFV